VYTAGYNRFGQMGVRLAHSSIMKVTGLDDKAIKKAKCGFGHSLFLTADYELYGSGSSDFGQLVSNHLQPLNNRDPSQRTRNQYCSQLPVQEMTFS
jgi:alpha-tubulin suppressor-like RCC1 family protein